jgi:hypothetical protein
VLAMSQVRPPFLVLYNTFLPEKLVRYDSLGQGTRLSVPVFPHTAELDQRGTKEEVGIITDFTDAR